MSKRKISAIIVIILSLAFALALCGCLNVELTTVIYVQRDDEGEKRFALNRDTKTAALYHCKYYYPEHIICEIPSQVEYKEEFYTVTAVEPELNFFYGRSLVFSNLNLQEIIVPETVEKLDLSFSEYMDCLEKVTVHPNNSSYKSINGVVYSKDGTEIVYYPLANRAEALILSKYIKTIGYSVNENTYIKGFFVEEGNEAFSSKDGVLYSADGTELICYPSGKDAKHFAVPQTVKKICVGSMAFDGIYLGGKQTNLETVYIPSSVQIIEKYSFYYPLKVFCEQEQIDINYNINNIEVQFNVSLEQYQNIISTWEDKTNDGKD